MKARPREYRHAPVTYGNSAGGAGWRRTSSQRPKRASAKYGAAGPVSMSGISRSMVGGTDSANSRAARIVSTDRPSMLAACQSKSRLCG